MFRSWAWVGAGLACSVTAWADTDHVPSTPTSPVAEAHQISILPGFEPAEMSDSIEATVDAALECISAKTPLVSPRSLATPNHYFAQSSVDGVPTDTWSRTAVYECDARPIRRCSFTYVWDENHEEMAYATLECSGSERGRTVNYSAVASVELDAPKHATKKVKGSVQTSLNFYTNAFPGTNTWASMSEARSDGTVIAAPSVSQFDDFSSPSTDATAAMSVQQMNETAGLIRRAACSAVGLQHCDPTVSSATGLATAALP
ncbi:MAG: hypothetical protein ACON5B_08215 [Myxococcota bacterium]